MTGLDPDSLQGDRVYRKFFENLKEGPGNFDLSDCPDLAPVLMALASAKEGAYFTGTARLRVKESDRGAVMAEELAKLSVKTAVYTNEIEVSGGELKPPKEPINAHNDHRIVMAMSLLLTLTGGIIEGAEAVKKSYPAFFDDIRKLGIKVEEI